MRFIPLIPIAFLVVSDLRHRYVELRWLLALGMVAAVVAAVEHGWERALCNTVMNIALLVYLGTGVVLYLCLRNRRWINPLRRHTGSGDLVFLLCLVPLYDLRGYLIMMLSGLVLALVWWATIRIVRRTSVTIPLVAMLGIVVMVGMIINICT